MESYKAFVDFLKTVKLYNEDLPIKTIYKRLRCLQITIIKYDYINKSTMSQLNTALSSVVNDRINVPFFRFTALTAKVVNKDNKIKLDIGIPPTPEFSPVFSAERFYVEYGK